MMNGDGRRILMKECARTMKGVGRIRADVMEIGGEMAKRRKMRKLAKKRKAKKVKRKRRSLKRKRRRNQVLRKKIRRNVNRGNIRKPWK
jgi:hypothetical protein